MSLLTRPGRIGLVLAAALIAVDQATKAWAINLPELVPHDVVWPLRWTRIWNEGVSFGLLQASHDLARWALFAFSVIVGALLANWARTQTRLFPAVALGLIVAGAWGNAIDRAIRGHLAAGLLPLHLQRRRRRHHHRRDPADLGQLQAANAPSDRFAPTSAGCGGLGR
jgi:signal peptidase II